MEAVATVLIVPLVLLAMASGWVAKESIKEEDAGSAWLWGVVFLVSSLLFAWLFWEMR